MASRNPTFALILSAALAAITPARADEAPAASPTPAAVSTVTITSRYDSLSCHGLSRDEARLFARNAQRAGAHAKAAECFRIAGDPVSADRAQMRASADASAASAERIKASLETTKAQTKRLRAALRNLDRG